MPPLPTTSDLLRLYGIKAKKKLSQNFILDPRILQRFVKIGGKYTKYIPKKVSNKSSLNLWIIAGKIENEYAIEVGPGPGGITRAILDAQVKEVHVIEKDPRFIPTLKLIQESVGPERLFINIGDCLHFNASSKFYKYDLYTNFKKWYLVIVFKEKEKLTFIIDTSGKVFIYCLHFTIFFWLKKTLVRLA